MNKNRREFLKLTGMAGIALGTVGFKSSKYDLRSVNPAEKDIKFISPIDGDMLNKYDGSVIGEKLITRVKIAAPEESVIKVNGVQASYINGIFETDISLDHYENIIELIEEKREFKESIKVFWLKNFANKYRLSLDDNIWFLKDISDNADRYKSIFENPYLGFLKQVHDTYGTKIHINIYYETDGFNISQLTDKFKDEWRANSGWIRLSFHAFANEPDRPYINASYEKVKNDCDMVMGQIRRFAGKEITGPVTTLHWGEATVEGCHALRDAGFKCLPCDFNVDNNLAPCSFYLDVEKRRHINKRLIWRDNKNGIIFVRCTIIIDTHKLEKIVPFLEEVKKDPHKSAYIDLLIHEQYFYPFYSAYQPEYRQKVLKAVKWASDNGYEPAFLEACVFN
ncbi:MAG: twin-arginine translocation signal domain-containing protein [Bacteroidales bacterium]|nr:twin-arginine translocation signal domain-containing protein [Bacteroidales bacterium]